MPETVELQRKSASRKRRNAMIGQSRPLLSAEGNQAERTGSGSQGITRSPWVKGVINPATEASKVRMGSSARILPAPRKRKREVPVRAAKWVGNKIKGGVEGKVQSMIRKNRRAVDDLNNNREAYDQMSGWDRFLWSATNPLARISAKHRTEGTEARNQRKAELEQKAVELAELKRKQGGYDLGDAGFDALGTMAAAGSSQAVPESMRSQGGAIPLHMDEAARSNLKMLGLGKTKGMPSKEEGQHGLTSTIRDYVLRGGAQMGVMGAGMAADTGLGLAETLGDTLELNTTGPEIKEWSGVKWLNNDFSTDKVEMPALTGVGEVLTGISGAGGALGGILGGVSSGMGMAGSIMALKSQADKKDYLGAVDYGLEATMHGVKGLSNLSGGVAGAADLAYALGGGVDAFAASGIAESGFVPGLGIATGALKMGKGALDLGRGVGTRVRLGHRKEEIEQRRKDGSLSRDDERLYRTVNQGIGMSTGRIVSGATKLVDGAAGVVGSGLTLGGIPGGAAVSGAGLAVGKVGDLAADVLNKNARTNTVEEELGLDAKIQKLMASDPSLSEREAKHVVLKSMGFSTGKRREAFYNITLRRAMELKSRADQDDKEAQKILSSMGVFSKLSEEDGYSLQAIVEALGMDSRTSWQEQVKDNIHSRAANPFAESVEENKQKKAKKQKKEEEKSRKKEEKKRMAAHKSMMKEVQKKRPVQG